jgi:hypothetical protein
MDLLTKLFRRSTSNVKPLPSLNMPPLLASCDVDSEIRLYLSVAANDRRMGEDEIRTELQQNGISEQRAYELSIFVPMAFARVTFQKARFSQTLLMIDMLAQEICTKHLDRQPIFRKALRWFIGNGSVISDEIIGLLAERSVEIQFIHDLAAAGLNPTDVMVCEPVAFVSERLWSNFPD